MKHSQGPAFMAARLSKCSKPRCIYAVRQQGRNATPFSNPQPAGASLGNMRLGKETEVNSIPEEPTITVRSIVWRGLASVALFGFYGVVNSLVYPIATLASGKLAGKQLANDDASYLISTYGVNFFSHIGWPLWLALLFLGMIWWAPAKALVRAIVAGAVASLMLIIIPHPAVAYYEKTDWPEIYYILPNESAFWIPDVGANKDAQAKFMSEEYLNENKIAAKRFQIPHAKVVGSSWTSDYFGPAGRLIVVDRTPYAREWTKDGTRGTSAANQAMQCQSSEGLDITIEIAISAAVFEADAPKFLYRFGVKPPVGDRNTDLVKFTSVYSGKSLTEVMDTVIHGKVQTLVCGYFSDKRLDEINAKMALIIADAEKGTAEYLIKSFGITLDYLGLAGSPEFSPTVQKAIDDRYAAEKITQALPVLERQAQIKVQEGIAAGLRGLGEGLKQHGLPSNLIAIPESLSKLFGGTPAAPAPVVTPRSVPTP